MKRIVAERVNEFVANQKAEAVVNVLKKLDPTAVAEKKVHLTKVVCRKAVFGHPAGVPFYAFAKNVGSQLVLVDVISGKADCFDGASLASTTEVKGRFKMGKAVYGVKDTIAGHKRYSVVRSGAAKPRKKITCAEAETME